MKRKRSTNNSETEMNCVWRKLGQHYAEKLHIDCVADIRDGGKTTPRSVVIRNRWSKTQLLKICKEMKNQELGRVIATAPRNVFRSTESLMSVFDMLRLGGSGREVLTLICEITITHAIHDHILNQRPNF